MLSAELTLQVSTVRHSNALIFFFIWCISGFKFTENNGTVKKKMKKFRTQIDLYLVQSYLCTATLLKLIVFLIVPSVLIFLHKYICYHVFCCTLCYHEKFTCRLILQVDYSGFMTINPQRFGQKYVGKVAVTLFWKLSSLSSSYL